MSTNYLDDLEEILNQKPPQNYFMDFMEWFAEMNNDTINKFIKRANLRTIQKLAECNIKTFTNTSIEFIKDVASKYLSDFISTDTVKKWDHTTPVFISAQTGSGKSYFIQHTLLDMLVDSNPYQKNSVLLLSNRIALNRQFKIQLADLLVSLTGDVEYKKAMEKFYTVQGIDKFCYQFGIITACSYHQLFENKSIDLSGFKYIICDECHFFTADSLFNPNTNEILKRIVREGNNAVRIYMSATPEIAFQPIVWAEVKYFNKLLFNKIQNWYDFYKEDPNLQMQQVYNPFFNLDREISERTDEQLSYDLECKRTILFYYLNRNYDYLTDIFSYSKTNELIECITASNEKWLIFVHSQNEGYTLKNLLAEQSIDSVFISRQTVESDPNAQAEYNFIIENEALSQRVVIATSILDNGINIKNDTLTELQDKTLNIVINSFDRTQFLQMLGRIRVNPDDHISFFIKKYSFNDLKNMLLKNVDALLTRLANDFHSVPIKKETFDKQIFRFTESPEIFSEYNPCAIYQLIDNIILLLNTIRLNEPDFCVKFTNDDKQALKTDIYHYYHWKKGSCQPWSKHVFDILETPSGWIKREKNAHRLKTNWSSGFYRTFVRADDDFEKAYGSSLDDTIHNYLTKKLELEVDLPDDLSEPLCVQLQWINKNLSDVKPISYFKQKVHKFNFAHSTSTDSFEEIILNYCVTETEIDNHRTGSQKKYVNKTFLEQHGILKGSSLEKMFSDKFFNGKPLGDVLRENLTTTLTLDDTNKKFSLRSFNDNTNLHKTFYIFVCID